MHRLMRLVRRLEAGGAFGDDWTVLEEPGWPILVIRPACHWHRACYYFTRPMWRAAQHDPQWRYLRNALSRGDVFVDAGANVGLFTMLAARHIDDITVIAIEPEPITSEALRRSAEANGLDQVRVVAEAAGAAPGRAGLARHVENFGGHSLHGRGERFGEHVTVPVDTVPNMLDRCEVDPRRVAAIKIDVEKSELDVIRGLVPTFEAGCRPAIVCEVRGPRDAHDDNERRRSAVAIADLLSTYGYTCGRLSRDGSIVPCDPSAIRGIADVIFTTPSQ